MLRLFVGLNGNCAIFTLAGNTGTRYACIFVVPWVYLRIFAGRAYALSIGGTGNISSQGRHVISGVVGLWCDLITYRATCIGFNSNNALYAKFGPHRVTNFQLFNYKQGT